MAICIQSANQKLGSGGTRLRHPILLFLVIFSVAKKNSGKRSFQQTETSQCLPYLDVPSFQLGSMMNGSNSRFFLTPNQKNPTSKYSRWNNPYWSSNCNDPPTVLILLPFGCNETNQASIPVLHTARDTWRNRIHPWWSRRRRSNSGIHMCPTKVSWGPHPCRYVTKIPSKISNLGPQTSRELDGLQDNLLKITGI